MSDTPGTTPDPELGSEGDSDQLAVEDTLLGDQGVDELDVPWSPPERAPRHLLVTQAEELAGDSFEDRAAQEEPEVWEVDVVRDPAGGPGRVGRLAADADGSDLLADDEGLAGGAASAEEAAMHLTDDELED